MAKDENGDSIEKSSPKNSVTPVQQTDTEVIKSDEKINVEESNNSENGEIPSQDIKSSSTKSTGAIRKDDNPFSFRHFLKRDLSLPGTSTYENTGARPKVYANTVHHSPTRLEINVDPRREKHRTNDYQAKEKKSNDVNNHHISDNNKSLNSSVKLPCSVADSSSSKHNFYKEDSETAFYKRPNLASEPLGMPSLPDFVQDHILVEQTYLNTNGPISVDLDNLPDFTVNTNYNSGLLPSSENRGISSNYCQDRYYSMNAASTSNENRPLHQMPLDLPTGSEATGYAPLDLPMHLNLDLTESVNPSDRRNVSPQNTFPLDLPPNAGAESMRLPDFLPVHPGRTSPELEHQDVQLQQILSDLERARNDLVHERARSVRLEAEAAAARREVDELRERMHTMRSREREYIEKLNAAACGVESSSRDSIAGATDADSVITKLKQQIRKLKEELAASESEVRQLRSVQSHAASNLRSATSVAETSLRELLAGLGQLKTLSNTLDPA